MSALWLAGSIALGWISAPSYSSTTVYVGGPDSLVGEKLSTYGPSRWKAGSDNLFAYLPEIAGAMSAAEGEGDVAALTLLSEAHLIGEAELRANRFGHLFGFALVALAPPASLLVLGTALGWALRGFRRPKS